MKKLSVILDESATIALEELISKGYTITDAANIALVMLNRESQECEIERTFYTKLKGMIFDKFNMSISNWCVINNITLNKVRYVCRAYEEGKTISGFGNYKNKWRDKNTERLFKTETAKIANCIKRDFKIDVSNC